MPLRRLAGGRLKQELVSNAIRAGVVVTADGKPHCLSESDRIQKRFRMSSAPSARRS